MFDDPLSPLVWTDRADDSYVASRLLWFTRLYIESPVQAHRTIELYLKAYLVSKREEVKHGSRAWGHRLSHLREVCEDHSPDFGGPALSRRLAYFERYFDFVRYPSASGPSDGSLVWLSYQETIEPLDEIIAFLRPRIQLADQEWRGN